MIIEIIVRQDTIIIVKQRSISVSRTISSSEAISIWFVTTVTSQGISQESVIVR